MLGTRGIRLRRAHCAGVVLAALLAVASTAAPAVGDSLTAAAGYGGEYNYKTVTYVDGDGNSTTAGGISGGNLRGSSLGWMGCVWDAFWQPDDHGIHRTFCFTVYSIPSGPDSGSLRVFLEFAQDEWGEEWEKLGPLTVDPGVLTVAQNNPAVLRLVGTFPEIGAVDLTLNQDSEWLSSAATNSDCDQSYDLTSRSGAAITWTDGGGSVGGYSVHTPGPFSPGAFSFPPGQTRERDRCAAAFVGATDGTWGSSI